MDRGETFVIHAEGVNNRWGTFLTEETEQSKAMMSGWRPGSGVKSTCCRGTEFDSKDPNGSSKISDPGDPMSSCYL